VILKFVLGAFLVVRLSPRWLPWDAPASVKVVQGAHTTWVVRDESHVSVGSMLGIYLFWEGSLLWVLTYFWRKICFEKDLILECKQQVARKQQVEKKGKETYKRKNNVPCRYTSLTMIGLGFLTKIVMVIRHKVV